eukprot:772158-Pyramimonas_sp.AAC.1
MVESRAQALVDDAGARLPDRRRQREVAAAALGQPRDASDVLPAGLPQAVARRSRCAPGAASDSTQLEGDGTPRAAWTPCALRPVHDGAGDSSPALGDSRGRPSSQEDW